MSIRRGATAAAAAVLLAVATALLGCRHAAAGVRGHAR